ncbi:MAG: adenylate/guanylate cyclase domain-containing protein [Deltaproteobacteria bacterium]|nr:adenylate/guanylate cyclase domain-containing protein [Deltaproteobacteria bacterium]MBW2446001.1 adenylate/guanylate cyclase domain-containing protein [Deltaproteobacteria bacterium]
MVLWAGCFTLSVRSALLGTPISSLYVAASPEVGGHPTVKGFVPWLDAERSGLRPGDRLLRLGSADLAGVGAFGFFATVPVEANRDQTVPVVYERSGERATTVLPLGSLAVARPALPASLAFFAAALLLFVRARSSAMGRAFSWAFFAAAIAFASYSVASPPVTYGLLAIHACAAILVHPLALRAIVMFPQDAPRRGPLARYGPWLFAVMGVLELSAIVGAPLPHELGNVGIDSAVVLLFLTCLVVGTRNYRRTDAVGRRQVKWALFGLYCAMVPSMLAGALAVWNPVLIPFVFVSYGAFALVPIGVVVAIVRYNMFDIDRMISATASYNVSIGLLVATGLVAVPRVAEAASLRIGIDPASGQIALSLALAALIVPADRRLRPLIERAFFRERYALARGVEALHAELSLCATPQELLLRAGERLQALIAPESCVIYAQAGESFAPSYVHGRVVPSAVDGRSELIAALGSGAFRRDAPRASALAGAGRAVLESLGAQVVVPVQRDGRIEAFVCLGAKGSGDVYTETDLALLSGVASKLSAELSRFDDAEVLRQARKMQDDLRRYVPGAVATQLERGHKLESEEREVSVLFVDIRGYTKLSDGQGAREVFSTVNDYTRKISELINKHAGSVVEFNGDGMMAVFGAPEPLPQKEAAALAAGRAILESVPSVRAPGSDRPGGISVGVGIATGTAFVGNIRAVDREIWSAIGDTTNLAARLQDLTRDLDAAMVIDEATRNAAGPAADDLRPSPAVAIRGRRHPEDVFTLKRSG